MLQNNIILGIIGGDEIVVVLIIVLLLFGGRKIPELMKGLGKGIKEFKDASNGADEQTPQSTANTAASEKESK